MEITLIAISTMTSAVAQEGDDILSNAEIVLLTDTSLQP